MSEGPESANNINNRSLTSWKEIAQHFGRDVRTVQRWEKEEGLPVHRHSHKRQSSVYAYPEELRGWWEQRGSQIQNHAADSPPAPARSRGWVAAGVAVGVVTLLVGLGLGLYFGRGTASAPAPAFRTVTFDGTRADGYLRGGVVGDLNGDGNPDLVISAGAVGEVYILFGPQLPAVPSELPAAASVVIHKLPRGYFMAKQAADYNGDGIDDLLISEALPEPEMFERGSRSYLFFGRKEWPKTLRLPEDADVTFRPVGSGEPRLQACQSGTERPDLNGDGLADVLLGAVDGVIGDRRSPGRFFVFFGRSRWSREFVVDSDADVTILGSRTGEGLSGLCAAGDFTGDGLPDLAAYANEGQLWHLLGDRGRTYVFRGRSQWPERLDALTDFDFRVDGVRPNSYDSTLASADLNGDGADDLVLGRATYTDAPQFEGRVEIWFGGPERRGIVAAEKADVVIEGNSAGDHFGHAFATADFDGDGFDDLIVSAPGRGEVFLLYGRREWKPRGRLAEFNPVRLFAGERGAGKWEIAVADFDGDQLPEVVFTHPDAQVHRQPRSGRAWVLEPHLPLRVDIRPDAEPNVILLGGGVSAVRIYGQPGLPATDLDPATVRFAGAPAIRTLVQDFNGDGIPDLQAYFDNEHLGLTPENTKAAVTARTRSGFLVGGNDSVHPRPQGHEAAASGPARSPSTD